MEPCIGFWGQSPPLDLDKRPESPPFINKPLPLPNDKIMEHLGPPLGPCKLNTDHLGNCHVVVVGIMIFFIFIFCLLFIVSLAQAR